MLYCPCITSPADATFMNENCPVEALNLNNPSQLFQEVVCLCFTVPCKTQKFFYFDDLPKAINAKQWTASKWMNDIGLTPIADFTFIDQTPTAFTTACPTSTHPPNQINTSHHTPLPIHSPTSTTISPMLPSLSPHNETTQYHQDCDIPHDSESLISRNNIDNDMSTQTSIQLNLNPASTNKRACSTSSHSSWSGGPPLQSQYTYFSTPINKPTNDMHAKLQTALADVSILPNLVSLPLLTCAIPLALHANKKHLYVQIHGTTYSTQILWVIWSTIQVSMPW